VPLLNDINFFIYLLQKSQDHLLQYTIKKMEEQENLLQETIKSICDDQLVSMKTFAPEKNLQTDVSNTVTFGSNMGLML